MKQIKKNIIVSVAFFIITSSFLTAQAAGKMGADCKGDIEKQEMTWVIFSKKTCKPCSKVMKVASTLYDRFKDKGLNIIVIATDNDIDGVTQKMKDAGLNALCYPAKDNEVLKDKVKDGVPQSIFYKRGVKQSEPILGAFDMKKAEKYLKKYFGL